mgnify:CR=1 FL=1
MSIQCFCCHINKGNFKGWIVRIWQIKSSSHHVGGPGKVKNYRISFISWLFPRKITILSKETFLGNFIHCVLQIGVNQALDDFHFYLCSRAFEEFWPSATLLFSSTSCCQFSVISWLYCCRPYKKIFVGVGSQALEPLDGSAHTNCNTTVCSICKVEKLLQIIS